MLRRFSLYGFLKNQRYHEPFFVLALIEQGLGFFEIGLLIGIRELCVTLLEIPSGALADVYGRRRCMVVSFAAYILSLVLLALAPGMPLLCAAMVLYAIGDAFRSGTHKAMIFEWLRAQGRASEKAEVYGYTRSWSKRGAAVGALAGAGIALWAVDFTTVFWFTLIPYAINLVNLATYPRALEGSQDQRAPRRVGEVVRVTARGLRDAARVPALRRLLGESMAFHGSHKLAREYLQPMVALAIVGLPWIGAAALLGDSVGDSVVVGGEQATFRGTAIALGLAYFALGLIESAASRRAGSLARALGGPGHATRWLWRANLLGFALVLGALRLGWTSVAVVVFLVQTGALQNLFRPVQLARLDEHTPAELQATILSIESQSKALFVAALAPLVGLALDRSLDASLHRVAADVWIVAALGCAWALLFCVLRPARPRVPERSPAPD